MLGINSLEAAQQIAAMPTTHSWALPLLKAKTWKEHDEKEQKMCEWVETLSPNETATRMLREVMLLYLERKAIAMFVEQNPQWMGYLPTLMDASEAAKVAQREVMADEADAQEVEKLLLSLESRKLTPPSAVMN